MDPIFNIDQNSLTNIIHRHQAIIVCRYTTFFLLKLLFDSCLTALSGEHSPRSVHITCDTSVSINTF